MFPNKGLSGGANDLTEMLLYICPDGYELKGKDKVGYLDPVTGKLYLDYQNDDGLLKVLYPENMMKNTIDLCLVHARNAKRSCR